MNRKKRYYQKHQAKCLAYSNQYYLEHKLHIVWYGMRRRCLNHLAQNYERYGGRGITICPAWLNDYKEFEQWAHNHGYQPHLSIDRIDNDKGYSPQNCRWIPLTENNRKPALPMSELPLPEWFDYIERELTTSDHTKSLC